MYKDPFTGKYHTHFRDYDPITCRWLSEDPAGYADGLNLYGAYMGVNGRDPLGDTADPESFAKILAGQNLTSCASCHKGKDSNQLMPNFASLGSMEPQYTDDQLLRMHLEHVQTTPIVYGFTGYVDPFGVHRTFCGSCHDMNNPNSTMKMKVARATLKKSWGFFIADQIKDLTLLPFGGSTVKTQQVMMQAAMQKAQRGALIFQLKTSMLRMNPATKAPYFLTPRAGRAAPILMDDLAKIAESRLLQSRMKWNLTSASEGIFYKQNTAYRALNPTDVANIKAGLGVVRNGRGGNKAFAETILVNARDTKFIPVTEDFNVVKDFGGVSNYIIFRTDKVKSYISSSSILNNKAIMKLLGNKGYYINQQAHGMVANEIPMSAIEKIVINGQIYISK